MNSYKTIDGKGTNVHIANGPCIMVQYVSHIIIHEIHIHDCKPAGNAMVRDSPTHYGWRTISDGDGVSIFGASNIWVDHCSLSSCTDGLIDAIIGSTAITISNNFMAHHDKFMLLGHNDNYTQDVKMQVTVSFNHFVEGRVQRMLSGECLEALDWRSEGDLMLNEVFFFPSGACASSSYTKASSLSARPSPLVASLTGNAGVLT
eukprot:PITA_09269